MTITWKNKFKNPRLVLVVAVSMLLLGLFCLPFSILGLLESLGVIPSRVSWFVNLPVSLALFLSSILFILHFSSCLTRKQNQLQFNSQYVVFRPAHADFSLFVESQGWHAVASDNWGLNRGLITQRIPIGEVKLLKLEDQTIILSLRGNVLRIEQPELNCKFEEAVDLLRELENDNAPEKAPEAKNETD